MFQGLQQGCVCVFVCVGMMGGGDQHHIVPQRYDGEIEQNQPN